MTITPEAGATIAPATGRRRTDADLAAELLTTIRAHGSEWTTSRAAHWLNTVDRYRARKALVALATAGHLIQHDRHGRRHFTLNHAKDHA
jgi:hypothetical protein